MIIYIILHYVRFPLKSKKVACLIQGVWYKMLYNYTVIIKDMARNFLCRTTLSWRHIIGMRGKPHQCNQRKQSDSLNCIHLYYVSRIHGHIKISNGKCSLFPPIHGSNGCSSSSKLNLERTRGTISLYADSYSHHPIIDLTREWRLTIYMNINI